MCVLVFFDRNPKGFRSEGYRERPRRRMSKRRLREGSCSTIRRSERNFFIAPCAALRAEGQQEPGGQVSGRSRTPCVTRSCSAVCAEFGGSVVTHKVRDLRELCVGKEV